MCHRLDEIEYIQLPGFSVYFQTFQCKKVYFGDFSKIFLGYKIALSGSVHRLPVFKYGRVTRGLSSVYMCIPVSHTRVLVCARPYASLVRWFTRANRGTHKATHRVRFQTSLNSAYGMRPCARPGMRYVSGVNTPLIFSCECRQQYKLFV
jgi:hypothetical protein